MPIVGVAIDYGAQVASGENAHDALAKTGAHVIASVGIGLAVAGVGLTGGAAIAVAAVVAVVGLILNDKIDDLYDTSKKIMGDGINAAGKWLGNLF